MSAGCDNLVKIWGYREDSQSWVEEDTLEVHTDWVGDVAWEPNIGLPRSYIATAPQVHCCDQLPKTFVYTISRTKLSLSGRKITSPHCGWKQLFCFNIAYYRPRAASFQTSSGGYLGVWLKYLSHQLRWWQGVIVEGKFARGVLATWRIRWYV